VWRWLATLVGGTVLLGLPGAARAQVGTGWTEFFPMKTIQLRGAGAKYDNTGGIETFRIAPGDERSEMRIHDDHRTGKWQFEGWVNIPPGINGGSVHQVFKFLMIVGYSNDGGELRQHSQQRLNATGVIDKWVRVNTIHDADAGKAEVYIDGTLRGTVVSKSPGPNGWYHKYGIYNSSGSSPVVKWRDVRFFTGAGTSPPPATDGGISREGGGTLDAARPADVADPGGSTGAADAAAGGQGGSAGSGGSGGPVPADAAAPKSTPGGSGGNRGSSTPEPEPEPDPRPASRSGGGCHLGGAEPEGVAGQALAVLVVLLAGVILRRRGDRSTHRRCARADRHLRIR